MEKQIFRYRASLKFVSSEFELSSSAFERQVWVEQSMKVKYCRVESSSGVISVKWLLHLVFDDTFQQAQFKTTR